MNANKIVRIGPTSPRLVRYVDAERCLVDLAPPSTVYIHYRSTSAYQEKLPDEESKKKYREGLAPLVIGLSSRPEQNGRFEVDGAVHSL